MVQLNSLGGTSISDWNGILEGTKFLATFKFASATLRRQAVSCKLIADRLKGIFLSLLLLSDCLHTPSCTHKL
jgi:hypothetical protein